MRIAPATKGLVSLVGAGPGDPELITLKGLRRLRQAEVVIYDRLVPAALLEEVRPDAQCINAGKTRGKQVLTQEDIQALLIAQARAGLHVVRLKGGDPSIFGRSGEEIQALTAAGIPFEIIPGVTAATAAAARAGIPLTQRQRSSTVVLTTGEDAAADLAPSWKALGALQGTLVVYMPVHHLEQITAALIEGGRAPGEAALVVEGAYTAQERILAGALSTIAEQAREADIHAPALLLCGPTVEACSLWQAAGSAGEAACVPR